MNDPNSQEVIVERAAKALLITLAIGLVVLVLGVDLFLGGAILIQAIILLLFGWMSFLVRVCSQITIDWPAIASAIVVLGLFVVGFHWFVATAIRQRDRSAEAPSSGWSWRWRYTFSIVAITLVLFAAGTAMVGIAHQWTWLIRGNP